MLLKSRKKVRCNWSLRLFCIRKVATAIQKHIVPWSIAMFRLSFPKMQTIETYREMYILHPSIDLNESEPYTCFCRERARLRHLQPTNPLKADHDTGGDRGAGAGCLSPQIVQHPNALLLGDSVDVRRWWTLKPKHFKRTMLDDEVVTGGGKSCEATPAAAAEDAAGNVPLPPPTQKLLPPLPHPLPSSKRDKRVPGRVVQSSSSE